MLPAPTDRNGTLGNILEILKHDGFGQRKTLCKCFTTRDDIRKASNRHG